jgi:eukaryotic-like serine/threonine-protein kinase
MMNALAAGQSIADRYLLERRIAVGGMGEVWEASDQRLGRSVAVKVLRPELSDDPEFLHRFRIEARTVASLDHSGIAAVHDYGEDETPSGKPTAYLVMELVRGEPLSTLIARGPIPPDETLRIIEEAGWALQAAHERGFVHRDVKPGNILVRTDGIIKLTDFGIAKAADAVPVTRSGMVMGTAHYIAPEQASGAEAGPAGDVYSLGIVGYECLAGHRPFRADSAVAVAMMQVRNEPPPLPMSVPRHARELIESVLVKDPTQRYGSGGEFAAAVAAVRRGEALPAPGATPGAVYTPVRGVRPSVSLLTPPPAPVLPSKGGRSPAEPPRKQPGGDRIRADRQPQRQQAPKQGSSNRHSSEPPDTVPPRRGSTVERTRDQRPGAATPARPATGPRQVRPTGPQQAPLRLKPGSGRSRKVLIALFVLIALAALAVGVLLIRQVGGGASPLFSKQGLGVSRNDVSSRPLVLAAAAAGGPDTGGVR